MALTIKSIYGLWALCSDLVYVILFPQLLCAIYVPFVNTCGSLVAFFVGIILRLGGGEKLIGLRPFIKYPLYDSDLEKQLFPFRTLAMVISLITLILVSFIYKRVFEGRGIFSKVDNEQGFELEGPKRTNELFVQNTYGTYSQQKVGEPGQDNSL